MKDDYFKNGCRALIFEMRLSITFTGLLKNLWLPCGYAYQGNWEKQQLPHVFHMQASTHFAN